MVMVPITVGPGLGLERGLLGGHLKSEPLDHRIQHMVMQPAQAVRLDLQRDMPVTEMIGRSQERLGIGRARARERLCGGTNLNHGTVVSRELVALSQRGASRQQDADTAPVNESRTQPSARALFERQRQNPRQRLRRDPFGRLQAPRQPQRQVCVRVAWQRLLRHELRSASLNRERLEQEIALSQREIGGRLTGE